MIRTHSGDGKIHKDDCPLLHGKGFHWDYADGKNIIQIVRVCYYGIGTVKPCRYCLKDEIQKCGLDFLFETCSSHLNPEDLDVRIIEEEAFGFQVKSRRLFEE